MALLTIALAVVFLAALDNPYILESTERLLRVSELPGTNVLALALAFTVSSLVGTAVLVLLFELRFRGFFAQIRSATYESIAAALCAAIAAYLGLTAIGIFADTTSTLSVFLTGLGGGLVGICAAGLTYFGLGSREYAETFASVRARLWRAQPKEEVTLVSSAEE
jgi:hypothetical protein